MGDCRAERSCVRVLLPVLCAGMLLGLAAPGWAQSEQYPHTAESPAPLYWYRNVDGVGPQAGAMDARLREISDAFGRGEFGVSRRLAEALVEAADDDDLRSEAAWFLIECDLAEGDFDGALAAAEGMGDGESAARISGLKAEYLEEVGRLQQIAIGATDARKAAQAQLLTARAHRMAGLLNVAQESYWNVVCSYPDRPEASWALSQVVEMHRLRGDAEGALAVCGMAIDQAPDSDAAVRACEEIEGLGVRDQPASREVARGQLREIAVAHPRTRSADTARLCIGELYAAGGRAEEAEEEWTALVAERPGGRPATDARYRLADLRYEQGMEAFFGKDYESAVRWLGKLRPEVDLIGMRSPTLRFGNSPESRMRHAVFSLAEAYEKLERWGEAAGAYEGLATPGSPGEEVALFRAVRCYVNLGDRARARHECDRLTERFPDGPHTRAAEDLL